jgi:methyl-accepting chemotaxis protein
VTGDDAKTEGGFIMSEQRESVKELHADLTELRDGEGESTERLKENFAELQAQAQELADEVAEVADEADDATTSLSLALYWVEESCEALRKVLGEVEIVGEIESHVSDVRSAADQLNDLVRHLARLEAPSIADDNDDNNDNGDDE